MHSLGKRNSNYSIILMAVVGILGSCFFLFPSQTNKKATKTSIPSISNLDNMMSDRDAIPLSKMIGTSEMIILGEVEMVTDSSFIVKVLKQLKGANKQEKVEVLKLMPDKFASVQPPSYKKGHCFILFLIHPKNANTLAVWKTIGFGEGQMSVENNYVYFESNNIDGLEFKDYSVRGGMQYVQRYELPPFLNAVENYDSCFKWRKMIDDKSWITQKIAKEVQIVAYSKKSYIHKFLVDQSYSTMNRQ